MCGHQYGLRSLRYGCGKWLWPMVVLVCSGDLHAWAGTYVWTGGDGSSQLWSTPSNWQGGSVPVSASDTIIQFDVITNPGTSTNPLVQNIASPLQLNELTFGSNADVSYYISGNPLQFVANGSTQPMFRNYGQYNKYFYNEIQVPAGVTLRLINDTYHMRMEGVISGDGALQMEAQGGGGEWHLLQPNTYTGGTIYKGTANPNQGYCRLAVYASGGLGTGPVTLNGGNISTATQAQPRAGLHFMTANTSFSNNFLLQANSPIFASATGISLSGNVDLSDKTLYLRGTGSATLSGTISGTGGITKLDTGTWTLSGNNTYTGSTTVSAGTLLLGHPNALGTATSTVQLGDSGTGDNNVALLTDVWADHTGAFTISRNISVNNVGNGTVTIGSNAAGAAGKYVVFSGTITLNNKDLHVKGVNVDRTTLTGKITGTGNLYIDGPQRITASYNGNDFVGDVFITAGTFQIDTGANVIPDTSNVTVASGATLRIWGKSEAINGLNGAGTVQVEYTTTALTGTLTVGAANGSGTFSGTLRDAGTGVLALVKDGTGTQTLSGPLNHTGGTTVNAGTLVLAQPGVAFPSLGSTGQFGSAHTVTINSGGTLQLDTSWVTGDGLRNKAIVNGGMLYFGAGDNYWGNIELTAGQINTRTSGNPWRTGNWGSGLIKVNASAVSSTISGRLCFVGTASAPVTTFDVADGAADDDLVVLASIYDHGGFEGQMALVKEGPGTMVLSGTGNTYGGQTRIQAGVLKLGASEVIPHGTGKGNVVLNGGDSTAGILDLNGFNETINGLSGTSGTVLGRVVNNKSGSTATLTVGAGDATASFAGILADNTGTGGTLALVKTGTGTQTLSGPLNHTGGTTVNAGTLVLAQPGVAFPSLGSTGQFGSAQTIVVNAGATLRLGAYWVMGDGLQHTIKVNGGTLEFYNSDNYQGKIELTGGRITTTGGSRPWRTGNFGNGLITVKASSTSSTIEGSLCFVRTTNATQTTFDVENGAAAQDLIVSAMIFDHPGAEYAGMQLIKTGAGVMVLSNTSNSYAGHTIISAGVLQLDASEVIPHGTGKGNVVLNGGDSTAGILDLNGFNETINGLSGTSGTVLGRVVNNKSGSTATLTVGVGDATATFAGTLANNTGTGGTLALVKTGTGTQTLSGPLNHTGGTTVNAGTLELAMPGLGWTTNGQFGSSGHVITVNTGATLRLTERGLLGNGQSHQLIINGGAVEFLHETYQSRIEMTGARIVSTASNYWRVGNWGNGQITVKASSTSSTIEQYMMLVKSASATKTTFDVEDGPAAQDLIVSAAIVDHGGGYEGMELVKAGAGTMVLSGTNTYIGPTTIQAGRLLLMGTHTPGTTPGLYTVAAGGTLGGAGTTKAPVLVQGTIAPGASVGTIYTGSETWAPGGTYQWEIQDVDAGPGIGWDLVDITGTLSITATAAQPFVIDVVSLGGGGGPGLVGDFNPLSTYSWEIARTTGGLVDFAPEKFLVDLGDFQNYWHGGRWWVSQEGNSLFLNYAIPEPASGLLALLALAGLGLWRWMSKR